MNGPVGIDPTVGQLGCCVARGDTTSMIDDDDPRHRGWESVYEVRRNTMQALAVNVDELAVA